LNKSRRKIKSNNYFKKYFYLMPLTTVLSVLGLGLAWRWEGLGGAINIGFFLASLAVHFWMISPRPYPYPIAIALPTPGVLFLELHLHPG